MALDGPEAGGAWEPSPAAALRRLAAVRPQDYARTRNRLDGAVTRLSPYITHGVLTLPQVLDAAQSAHRLTDSEGRAMEPAHKFISELAWREYFHHVWRHEGPAIFASLHPGPLPEDAYETALPSDIQAGQTGVPVIDQAVSELQASGHLHNHARLWLASYVVHVRKVHWRAGADWLYGHLLDGDLASNHLSWQWVAGTGSHKPYLFNAANVEKFAPPPWHSRGTVVDTTYEALEVLAHQTAPQGSGPAPAGPSPRSRSNLAPPAELLARPPFALPEATAPDLDGAWLIHPWNLRRPPDESRPVVGVFPARFHAQWPWSPRRWRWVLELMRCHTDRIYWCDAAPPASARTVDDPHLRDWLAPGQGEPVPRIWPDPGVRCGSFSKFWVRAQRGSPA